MILGLDLGTTNVKALLIDRRGKVVAQGSSPVERYYVGTDGIEQDIEEIWRATCAAVREAIRGGNAQKVRAVGVSSQGGAMQLLDAEGRPRGRVISWMDGRGRPYDAQIEKELTAEFGPDFFVEHVGYDKPAISVGQILRLRKESPQLISADAQIGFVGDVIVGRLCGRRAHDATSLSIALLLNPGRGKADAELLERLHVGEWQLPDLLPADTAAGRLTTAAAEATGLPAGIPVTPAIHDQYAAALGAGSVAAGDVSLGTGTAWVIVANTVELLRPAAQNTFVCPHPVHGLFGQMQSMCNGGSAVEWALSMMGDSAPRGEKMDRLLAGVPAGCDGLQFWPLLSPGMNIRPFEQAGGRMAGIHLSHGPQHVLRAVVEGLACELARHLSALQKGGISVERLAMSGAAAKSSVTPGIIADVVGCPVACLEEPSISAFGAGVAARALVEPGADLAELARELAPSTRTVDPGANARMYAELFERYLKPFE